MQKAHVTSGADPPRHNAIRNSACLQIEASAFYNKFDREPFVFSHSLSGLQLFSDPALRDLTKKYDVHPRDYFVSAGAPSADTKFFAVPSGQCIPSEAMERLRIAPTRILLKRPESHDPAFRELLDQLFAEIIALRGGLKGEKVVRLESSVFITSATSTTPFHFDPEIAFFSQIEGEKIYHVYPPSVLREAELEKFYLQGNVSIGQVDLGLCDPALEHVLSTTSRRRIPSAAKFAALGGNRSVALRLILVCLRNQR